MASLTKCLRDAGSHVSTDDKASIRSAAEEFRADGMTAQEAALKATEEVINSAIADYNNLTDTIAKKGVRLEHIPMYELPVTTQAAREEAGAVQAETVQAEETKQKTYEEQKAKERAKPTEEQKAQQKIEAGIVKGVEVAVKRKRRSIAARNKAVVDATYSPRLTPEGVTPEMLRQRVQRATQDIYKGIEHGAVLDFEISQTQGYPASDEQIMEAATTAKQVVDSLRRHLHPEDPWNTLLDAIARVDPGLDKLPVLKVDTVAFFNPGERIFPVLGRYSHDQKIELERTFDETGGMDERLVYAGPDRNIFLNDERLGEKADDKWIHVFIHELVHSATYHKVHSDNKAAMELERLRLDTIAKLASRYGISEAEAKGRWYGLTDVHEFMAEGFTNPDFQIMLANIPAEGQRKLGFAATLWTRFVESVGRILGIADVHKTRLGDVLALGEEMLSTYQEIYDDVHFMRAADWISEYRKESRADKEAYMREDEQIDNATQENLRGSGLLASVMGINKPEVLKEFNGRLRDGGERGMEALLGMLTNDTIETEFGGEFEGKRIVKQPDGTVKSTNPLVDYLRAKQAEQSEAKKFERGAELLHNKWRKMESEHSSQEVETFNKLIQEATMFEVHPDKAWTDPENRITRENNRAKKAGQLAHVRLRQQYNDLPQSMKRIYQEAKRFYKDTSEKMREQAIMSIADMYNLTNPSLRRLMLLAKTKEDLLKINPPVNNWENLASMIDKINSNMVANGPYFPQNRFGDYVLSYEASELHSGYASKEKAYEAAAEARSEEPGVRTSPPIKGNNGWQFRATVPGFMLFESRSEAEAKRQQMKEEGVRTGDVTKRIEFTPPSDSLPGQMLAMATRKIGDTPEGQRSIMVLREALIHMLPDTSIRKRFLRRKNIAGGDLNNRRSYASYVQSAGWHLARMKFRHTIDQAYVALLDAGKGKVDSNVTMRMSQVVNEMSKRHNMIGKRRGAIGRRVSQFGFINFLMSASYAVVNATQPYTMTLPHLAGKYGARKSTAALGRAYRMVSGQIGKTILKSKGGLAAYNFVTGEFDLNEATEQVIAAVEAQNPELATMLRTLADMGIIDATFSLEVSEAARSDKRGLLDQTIEAGRVVPFAIEIMNRATTAIAAYDLARQTGRTAEQATEMARLAVVKTQFDYSELNRPRFFVQNDVLRAMTMFKIYPLGVYSFIAHNIRKSLGKNATVEQRREGAKTMAMMLMTHGTLAGAAGSILMEPIRLMLTALAGIFDLEDDDEYLGWIANPEIAMRKFIYDVTDSAKLSEIVVHGLPRAVGIDLSARVGLQNLMIQWTQGDHSIRDSVINSIMGPLYGSATSFSRGIDYFANGGDTLRGLEYFMPKMVRDFSRAYRYAKTGMTDWNGNVIQDPSSFSSGEILARFLGFTTSTEAETYMGRSYIQGKRSQAIQERKAFMNRYARAETRAEQRDIWQEIQDYNNKLPEDMWSAYRITRAQLVRSLRERKRMERELEKGTRFKRSEREMQQRLDFLNP